MQIQRRANTFCNLCAWTCTISSVLPPSLHLFHLFIFLTFSLFLSLSFVLTNLTSYKRVIFFSPHLNSTINNSCNSIYNVLNHDTLPALLVMPRCIHVSNWLPNQANEVKEYGKLVCLFDSIIRLCSENNTTHLTHIYPFAWFTVNQSYPRLQ